MKPAALLRLQHVGATEPSAPNLWNLLLEHTQEQVFCAGLVLGICLGFGAAVFLAFFAEDIRNAFRGQPAAGFVESTSTIVRGASRNRLPRSSRSRSKGLLAPEEQLLGLLEQCCDEDAACFLNSVALGPRGALVKLAAAEAEKYRSPDRRESLPFSLLHNNIDESGEARFFPMSDDLPYVQFAMFEHLATEGDTVVLEVIRVGRIDGHSEVNYASKEGTAVEGEAYEGVSGKLIFKPGESSKQIEVDLMDNDFWDNSLNFKVVLFEEGLVGAVLNPHMWHARVTVIEDDAFPTNVYREHLQKNRLENIPKFRLMYEYFRFNLSMKVIRHGTIRMILVEQCHNFYFLLRLLLSVVLVDDVLAEHEGGRVFTQAKLTKLMFVALLATAPVAFLHILDVNSLRLAVSGHSKRILEKALLSKFLHYSQAERSSLRPGRVALAVVQDVEDLVNEGFLNFLALARGVGQYVLMIVFVCSVPLIFGRPLDLVFLLCILTLPAVATLFFVIRKDLTTWHLENGHRHFEKMANSVFHIVPQYSLIAAYNRQHTMMNEIDHLVASRNKAEMEAKIVLLNNSYMVIWLMTLAVSVYFVFGAWEVFSGQISLGMFLANISVYTSVGSTLDNIFSLCQSIERATPALERIAVLLNRPDDLELRKVFNEKAQAEMQRQLAKQKQEQSVWQSVDELQIRVNDVRYDYHTHTRKHARESLFRPVHLHGTINIRQGTLALLLGTHQGAGRATLLKLLGGDLLPQDAGDSPIQVFVPSHLRVIHVPGDPIFFIGTLYENLTFGVSHHSLSSEQRQDSDGNPDRVEAICRTLGVSEEILRYVRPENGEVQLWDKVLTATDSGLLNLARAFIANAEVLCLHKPMEMYDEVTSQRVATVIERFVRERGLEFSASSKQHRQVRTVIFTSSKKTGLEVADNIFLINQSGAFEEVQRENVTPDMLR